VIDTPRMLEVGPVLTAAFRLTAPRDQIQAVMGPATWQTDLNRPLEG